MIVPWHILPAILEEGSSWQRPLCFLLAHTALAGLAASHRCHSDPSSPLLTQTTSAGGKPPAQTGPTKAPHCLAHPSSLSPHLSPRGPHVGVTSLPPFPLPTCGLSTSLASCALPPGFHLWQPLVCSAPHLTAQRAVCRKSVQAQPRGTWLVLWQSSQSLLLTLPETAFSFFFNL